jgi:hypothetical protein
MCLNDKYLLRITNTTLADDVVTLSTDKSSFTFKVPEELIRKGKCNISVISSEIQLRNGTANRVVPDEAHIICLRTNLGMLGFSTDQSGPNNILGSGIIETNTTYVTALASPSTMTFTCMRLPPQIQIDRMYYDETTPFKLVAANNYDTAVVPLQITLQIEFFEDMKTNENK